MSNHRVSFLFICLLAALSAFGQITNISFQQPGDGATIACLDLSIQIIIESDSPVDPTSISMMVRDSLYNWEAGDTTFTWTPGSNMLEWIVPGDSLWSDGVIDVVLYPVSDSSGATSEMMEWSFRVDMTEPYPITAEPVGVTIEELDFEIEVSLEDPLVNGVRMGVDNSSVTVDIEGVVLNWDDPAIVWDGNTFTIASEDLTGISFEDNQVVNVQVHYCDLVPEVFCGPNCGDYQFSFTMGETPCYQEPNPITPNDDGKNDYVEFRFPDMRKASSDRAIHIFDIHGSKVREITSATMGAMWAWDGTDDEGASCGQGTYAFVIVVDDELICDGTVTILR